MNLSLCYFQRLHIQTRSLWSFDLLQSWTQIQRCCFCNMLNNASQFDNSNRSRSQTSHQPYQFFNNSLNHLGKLCNSTSKWFLKIFFYLLVNKKFLQITPLFLFHFYQCLHQPFLYSLKPFSHSLMDLMNIAFTCSFLSKFLVIMSLTSSFSNSWSFCFTYRILASGAFITYLILS